MMASGRPSRHLRKECNAPRRIYKSVPDEDPITAVLLKSLMMGIDQWHSLTSKRKGLAGMAENVRQGFRAGGRAPRGYRLATIETGAIREGAPVTKTKLEPNDDAPIAADYLRLRVEGIGRTALMRQLKIRWPVTSLIGMEWAPPRPRGDRLAELETLTDCGIHALNQRVPDALQIVQDFPSSEDVRLVRQLDSLTDALMRDVRRYPRIGSASPSVWGALRQPYA